MRAKTTVHVLGMLALLAFGPRENRDYLLRTPPDLLYGEVFLFESKGVLLSLARNQSGEHVELVGCPHVHVRSRSVTGTEYHEDGEGKVYANSMALIERRDLDDSFRSRIRVDGGLPRTARALRIQTEGEVFDGFVWPAIIVALAVVLTYLVNDFAWQCSAPIRDTLLETESS